MDFRLESPTGSAEKVVSKAQKEFGHANLPLQSLKTPPSTTNTSCISQPLAQRCYGRRRRSHFCSLENVLIQLLPQPAFQKNLFPKKGPFIKPWADDRQKGNRFRFLKSCKFIWIPTAWRH